ncbi:MAG: glycosyltransferase family 61 protein [Prosthecobacter sp.]
MEQATGEDIGFHALRTWTLQTSGHSKMDNALEHALNPDCPATLEMHWKEVRCWELSNVFLTGDDCNVFLSAKKYLRLCPSLQRHPERKIRRPFRLLSSAITEPCFYLAGRNYENHGHFLLHHLPRLMAAHQFLNGMGNPKVLLGNRAKRWQERYLSAVDVPPASLVRAGPGTTRVEKLFYAPQMWTDSALAAPEIIQSLRVAFLEFSQLNASGENSQVPILISRADAPDRKLLNEREIAAEVERQWGACEILELSRIDFATQIRKFAQAPLIVGALGQGLTNLLVSKGALCLILDTEVQWAESYFSQTFRDLALSQGNLATRLFADQPIQKRDHWSYPIEKFKRELSTATAIWKQHRTFAPTP